MSIQQGEIFFADLDPVQGREQRGRRPVLVITRDSINRLPLTVLVMVGTGAEHYQRKDSFPSDLWVTAAESGLPKDTVFLGLQIRSLDPSRLTVRLGRLPPRRLPEVWKLVRYLIGDCFSA